MFTQTDVSPTDWKGKKSLIVFLNRDGVSLISMKKQISLFSIPVDFVRTKLKNQRKLLINFLGSYKKVKSLY
jgi:ribosomal protein S2